MTGQSIGLRIGGWIGLLLLQAAIAYLITRLMQRKTINKVIVLMEALEISEQIPRRQFEGDSYASGG